MAFTGNLNAVAIADVVQLVGLAQRSGTLTVVTMRGRITVLFRDGYVVDASAVRFARPDTGDAGSEVKELHVRANLTGDPSQGVGLAEMAGKIFRLGSGHFNFQAGEPQTDSKVALDVSGLLLESFRLQDEAARDGALPANEYESLPGEEPEPVGGAEIASAGAQSKSSPLLHLFTLFRTLSESRTERERERVLLDAAREVFDRAILFRITEEELCGVGGYSGTGEAGTGEALAAALASIRIPRGVQSPMQDAVEVKHISVGEASDEWWREYIPGEFGLPPDTEYVAVPVVAGETCVLVLYGDTYAHREFADPLRALEVICKHVGVLTENEMLRSRKTMPQVSWRERLFGTGGSS